MAASTASSQRQTIITTSWDDGHPLDMRLAELLVHHGIPATFYVPRSSEFGTMPVADVREIARAFEIGAHTLNHSVLTNADDDRAWREISASRRWVEDVTGGPCIMFCPPTGRLARRHIAMARRAGYLGLRTAELTSLDFPRQVRGLLMQPTSVQAYPHTFRACARNAIRRRAPLNLLRYVVHGRSGDWVTLASSLLAEAARRGGVFHLWGHSWEIEQANQWQRLSDVLRLLGDRARSLTALTNGELCRRTVAGQDMLPGTFAGA
ncbi:MAG: polysaccharide deacetylase family protein [Hyphomicrobiaceae bacterium]|nr:polysaccharide deacetylase family protein [Hyphomicrobiaceae bacterium]